MLLRLSMSETSQRIAAFRDLEEDDGRPMAQRLRRCSPSILSQTYQKEARPGVTLDGRLVEDHESTLVFFDSQVQVLL